ncbi:MAG TPA: hypothetical protein DFR83_23000 [Deltaproteobacteria bacterium]|nr:hypothetical protein [Deltaproteobacteria bacterium]
MALFLVVYAWCVAFAGTLSVEVLDVGQGDSILVQTPAGKTILIDGGTGRRSVVGALERRGIGSVDLMVNTHAHADHLGGLDEVLEAFPVEVYADSGMPHTTESYAKVIRVVEAQNIRYKAVRAGQVFRFDDGIEFRVLGPHDPLLRGTRSDLNSNSVIARLEHGDVCFLMMGDAELETERQVLEHGLEPCEVLKVAHHGSAHASSTAFLEAAQPEWAAISAGRNNRYKHPAPEAVRRLEKSGATVLRTDLHGRILFESDGKRVHVAAAVNPPDAPLPDGVEHRPVGRAIANTPAAGGSTSAATAVVMDGTESSTQPAAAPTAAAPPREPLVSGVSSEGAARASAGETSRMERRLARREERRRSREQRKLARGGEARTATASAAAAPPPPAVPNHTSKPEATASAPPAGKFDINTATREQLIAVPGIGPARADAILQYRTANGPFLSIAALDAVSGIGPAIVSQLQNHAFVR